MYLLLFLPKFQKKEGGEKRKPRGKKYKHCYFAERLMAWEELNSCTHHTSRNLKTQRPWQAVHLCRRSIARGSRAWKDGQSHRTFSPVNCGSIWPTLKCSCLNLFTLTLHTRSFDNIILKEKQWRQKFQLKYFIKCVHFHLGIGNSGQS